MTEKPPHLKLADALMHAGLPEMSFAARDCRYHDFRSSLPDPASALDRELLAAMAQPGLTMEQKTTIMDIRTRHHAGEWDATKDESEEWAAGPDGQDALGRLMRGE